MSRLKRNSVVAAAAVTLVGGFEGLRQTAYPDPATKGEPWTICYGETEGVKRGDRRTIEQCKQGLIKGLDRYADGVEKCIHPHMPDRQFIAVVSLAWNIGVGGVCRSSVARLINEGRNKEACDAFLKYNRAAHIVFPGLTKRRVRERAICLEDFK